MIEESYTLIIDAGKPYEETLYSMEDLRRRMAQLESSVDAEEIDVYIIDNSTNKEILKEMV